MTLHQHALIRVAAGAGDVGQILASAPFGTAWPPPGCHVERGAAIADGWPLPGARDPVMVSDDDQLPTEGFWWTSLGELYLGFEAKLASIAVRALEAYLDVSDYLVAQAASIPIVYDPSKGTIMRWLHSTLRGTLFNVEEFQFGINWGKPGDDPDFNESQAGALAQSIAAHWSSSWTATLNSSQLNQCYPPGIGFTEVGVTQLTQTTNTDSHGQGGNLEQAYPTEWYLYPVGSVPVGAGSATSLPFEVSCCVTLNTDKRGPSGRGRLYMPPPISALMGGGGLFNPTYTLNCGAAIGDLFERVKSTEDLVPVVVSRRRGVLNEIKQITVGQVPDSQRRRRRSQDEAYVEAWTI